jgi:hypothetical protein
MEMEKPWVSILPLPLTGCVALGERAQLCALAFTGKLLTDSFSCGMKLSKSLCLMGSGPGIQTP